MVLWSEGVELLEKKKSVHKWLLGGVVLQHPLHPPSSVFTSNHAVVPQHTLRYFQTHVTSLYLLGVYTLAWLHTCSSLANSGLSVSLCLWPAPWWRWPTDEVQAEMFPPTPHGPDDVDECILFNLHLWNICLFYPYIYFKAILFYLDFFSKTHLGQGVVFWHCSALYGSACVQFLWDHVS